MFLIFFKFLQLFLKFEEKKLKYSILHTFLHIAIHFFSAHYDFLKNYLLQENIPSNCLLSMPWCFLGYFLWLVSIRNMFLRCSRALVFCFLFFSKKELVFLITVSYKTYCVYADANGSTDGHEGWNSYVDVMNPLLLSSRPHFLCLKLNKYGFCKISKLDSKIELILLIFILLIPRI